MLEACKPDNAFRSHQPPACWGGFPLGQAGLPKLGVLRERPGVQTGVLGFGNNVRDILGVLFHSKK